MNTTKIFLLTLALISTGASGASVSQEVPTATGKVHVLVDQPKGNGPFPLLIIAPAKKYLMKERLFARLATEAKRAGFISVRFDWGFSQRGEEPSQGFKSEAGELESVVRHFLKRADVKQDSVILAAKSMGSKAAMVSHLDAFRALLLLTPNCSPSEPFKNVYAPIFSAGKPVQITISRADPYCDVEQIYSAAKDLSPVLSLHTLEGDHNFVDDQSPGTFSNQDAAIQSSINWLKNQIDR